MRRFELAIEVGPIDPNTVARLKQAGHAVYRGNRSWRVVVTAPVLGRESIRAQAHAITTGLIKDFGLTALSDPPATSLRDPDAILDAASARYVLNSARRGYDPDPLRVRPRKWWQRAMELGLGERKE